jgi:hypothetical protein
MIPSYRIQETAVFFEFVLGFSTVRNETSYVILEKEGSMVHLLPAGEDVGEMEFYLEVDDIEKVWDGMKDHVEGLRYKAPFNQDYGMREIHVILPHTKTLLFIGQVL